MNQQPKIEEYLYYKIKFHKNRELMNSKPTNYQKYVGGFPTKVITDNVQWVPDVDCVRCTVMTVGRARDWARCWVCPNTIP